jgi:hypothetical protein
VAGAQLRHLRHEEQAGAPHAASTCSAPWPVIVMMRSAPACGGLQNMLQ